MVFTTNLFSQKLVCYLFVCQKGVHSIFFGLIVLSLRRRDRYRSHSPPTLKFGNPKNLEKKWNLFFLPKAQKNWVREKMRRDDFSNFPIFSVDRTNIGSPVWHWSHENLNFAADARKTFKHSKRFFFGIPSIRQTDSLSPVSVNFCIFEFFVQSLFFSFLSIKFRFTRDGSFFLQRNPAKQRGGTFYSDHFLVS